MSEAEQPSVDPYTASGEPTLKPEDYDFAVAGAGEAFKTSLDGAEKERKPLKEKVEESIARAAIESKHSSNPDPYQEGIDVQPDLIAATKKVDRALTSAKRHYRENQDQYVENAAQEYEAVKKDQDLRVEEARADIQNDPNYATHSIEVARDSLIYAYNNREKALLRAALAELSTSSIGVKTAKQFISTIESGGELEFKNLQGDDEKFSAPTMDADDRYRIALGINDNLASFESKDAAVSNWAGRAFGEEDSNGVDISKMGALKGADYAGLSVELLASQNADAARVAVGEGGITPEKALKIVNSDAQYQLTQETRQIYMDHAEKAATRTA